MGCVLFSVCYTIYMNKDIYVIPDTQSRPNVSNPLVAVAYHICEVKPSHIVHLGDHWDFPSLSLYDKGKKSHRVKTYRKDVEAGNQSMAEFFEILDAEWPKHNKECEKIILKGNHENRRERAIEYGPDELVDLMDLLPPDYTGWDRVVPFLKVFKLKDIYFSHYFQQDKSAGSISSAKAVLNKRHKSCIAGHSQGFDYAESITMDNRIIQCLIIGSCYYHKESYKGHTNHHWRGSVVLSNIKKGGFDFSRHSLASLDRTYLE